VTKEKIENRQVDTVIPHYNIPHLKLKKKSWFMKDVTSLMGRGWK
jgi:hypothetical protein